MDYVWPPPERDDPLRSLAYWLVRGYEPPEYWLRSRLPQPRFEQLWHSSNCPGDLLVIVSMTDARNAVAAACSCARTTEQYVTIDRELLHTLELVERWTRNDGLRLEQLSDAASRASAVQRQAEEKAEVMENYPSLSFPGEHEYEPLETADPAVRARAEKTRCIAAVVEAACAVANATAAGASLAVVTDCSRIARRLLFGVPRRLLQASVAASEMKPSYEAVVSAPVARKRAEKNAKRVEERVTGDLVALIRSRVPPPDIELLTIAVQLDPSLR